MTVLQTPNKVVFVGNPVIYRLSDTAATTVVIRITVNGTLHIPLVLKPFYPLDADGVIDTSADPYFETDISDILYTYAQPLVIRKPQHFYEIDGGVTFRVAYRDNDSWTDIDTSDHLGILGGLPQELVAAGEDFSTAIQNNTQASPFLIARLFTEGALHFYRSEMRAVDIFLTKPEGYQIRITHEFGTNVIIRDTVHNIVGIRTGKESVSSQSRLTLLIYDTGYANSYYYTIVIDDDPDTDEKHLLRFINSYGCYETLLCTGELRESDETDDPDFYNLHIGNASIRAHQRRLRIRKYTLHTGHLTTARRAVLADLLCSEEVSILLNNEWLPCAVTAETDFAVTQREPESTELTLELLPQSKYNRSQQDLSDIRTTRILLTDSSAEPIYDVGAEPIEVIEPASTSDIKDYIKDLREIINTNLR